MSLVWLIEDDPETAKILIRDIKEECPQVSIKHFECTYDSLKATGHPSIILCDVAGMTGGIGFGISIAGMASPIRTLMANHESAIFGLYSAVGIWADDVIEEIRSDNPNMTIEKLALGREAGVDFATFVKQWS